MLATPSDEQQAIIHQIGYLHNILDNEAEQSKVVIVDAVAGSGKTTTILLLAKQFPTIDIVQITYNTKLKQEVRSKVNKNGLTNLEIHTYHSLAMKLYGGACHTDEGIVTLLRNNTPLKSKKGTKFQVIIIDEAQDATVLLYSFMRKVLMDVYGTNDRAKTYPVCVFIGDKMQGVYQFMGADYRFLTLADRLYGVVGHRFTLSTTFRLTESAAWFVNHAMLGLNEHNKRLYSTKPGPPVVYLYMNAFTDAGEYLCTEIDKLLHQKGDRLTPEDILVIAPSVKRVTSPIRRLEHALVLRGIPCFVPINDDSPIKESMSSGKVLFSSLCQSKGIERKCVIVYGMDESYFQYFARDSDPNNCPPDLYVGTTRSMYYLYVVHNCSKNALPFMRLTLPELSTSRHIKFVGDLILEKNTLMRDNSIARFSPTKTTTVIELVQFLGVDASAQLTELCNSAFTCVHSVNRVVPLANSVSITSRMENTLMGWEGVSPSSVETVADVNGLVLAAMYEIKGRLPPISSIHKAVITPGFAEDNGFFRKALSKITKKQANLSIEDHLYIGLLYAAVTDDLYCRIAQIKRYDWVNEETAAEIQSNMVAHLPAANTLIFESIIGWDQEDPADDYYETINQFVQHHFGRKFGQVQISGRIDACNDDTVWELKCTDQLRLEHKLQLVVYAFLWKHLRQKKSNKCPSFRLFNIRTEEIWELRQSDLDTDFIVDRIMVTLLRNKYPNFIVRTDDEFIEYCRKYQVTGTAAIINRKANLADCLTSLPISDNEVIASGCNTSTIGRPPIYMVLDTETTGFSPTTDHIVQLSYVMCDSTFCTTSTYDTIVSVPPGVDIQNAYIHGITNEICRTKGRPFDRVARDTFARDLMRCTHVVAHNADFDLRMLRGAFDRYQCAEEANLLSQKLVICTMSDPLIMAITNKSTAVKYKAPKLGELYNTVLGRHMCHAHNALHDVLNLCEVLRFLFTHPPRRELHIITMDLKKIEGVKKLRQSTLNFNCV